MIRLWIVAILIASNGVHLAYKSIGNMHAIKINSGSIVEHSVWTLSLPIRSMMFSNHPILHHSTSNLDTAGDGSLFKNPRNHPNHDYQLKQSRWHSTDSGSSSRSWQRLQASPVAKYVRSLHWFHIPISLGLVFIAFQQFRHIRHREQAKISAQQKSDHPIYLASELEISLFKMLPLRTISRCWGWLNSIELPIWMRSPILGAYARAFGCNVEEALVSDLKQYRNLGDFFRRALKPGVRPINQSSEIVSPADGTIVYFGKARDGKVEQVKGISYPLKSFLGPQTFHTTENENASDSEEYQKNLLHKSDRSNSTTHDIYHCVIYLAPGDYHRFHSPTQWRVNYRRHFPGELLSVRPSFASWFPGLFHVNERVVYTGEWKHGFFSMAAVGATNVGSVKVYFDQKLVTNEQFWKSGYFQDQPIDKDVNFNKGDAFGEFNLGSTIVLIFEAPKNIKFDIEPGQKIKYGQSLTSIVDNSKRMAQGRA